MRGELRRARFCRLEYSQPRGFAGNTHCGFRCKVCVRAVRGARGDLGGGVGGPAGGGVVGGRGREVPERPSEERGGVWWVVDV